MAETKEERRARLEAELAQLDHESQEDEINAVAEGTALSDVISHLVAHTTGYPTHADREAHARAVRRHFKVGEYADDDDTPAQAEA